MIQKKKAINLVAVILEDMVYSPPSKKRSRVLAISSDLFFPFYLEISWTGSN
jgi:hypothetical protein